MFEKSRASCAAGRCRRSGGPRPDAETYDGFVAYLERRLDEAALAAPEPGKASIHRLNRTEYGNAVRDLLALEVDAAEFLPADDEGYGFDNIADVLRVSPSLLEQYLVGVGEDRGARGRRSRRAGRHGRVPRAAGSRAGRARRRLAARHARRRSRSATTSRSTPSTSSTCSCVRNIVGYMTGLEWAHELEIAVDGERVFLAQVGGEADNALSDENMSAAANEIDARLRTRTFVTAGPHDVTVAFLERSAAETHEPLELHTRNLDLQDMNGLPVVDYVNLRGPFNRRRARQYAEPRAHLHVPPGRRRRRRASAPTEILSTLARRAYRRQPTEQDIATLLVVLRHGRGARRLRRRHPVGAARDPHEPEVPVPRRAGSRRRRAGLAVRARRCRARVAPRVLPLERAARRRAARARRARQAQRASACSSSRSTRMLADPRASALVENFAGQWLFLRNLQSARPDVEEFPNFDDNLRQAMRRETELLVRRTSCARIAASRELLTADYTFVNERLARALRHAERLRQPLPPGARRRRGAPRAARPREHPDGHVVPEPHVARAARQVGARERARHAAAAAAARRARARGERGRQGRAHAARAARGASRESRLRDVPRRHGSDRARARELRRRRQVAHARAGRRDRRARPARGRHADRRRGRSCARR